MGVLVTPAERKSLSARARAFLDRETQGRDDRYRREVALVVESAADSVRQDCDVLVRLSRSKGR